MVYLFLANGFEETEALTPLDLLRRAGVEVTIVSVSGGETAVGSHGIAVQTELPAAMFRDAKPEMVILPGGMPGATNLDACPTVDVALRAAKQSGGFLAAICAAPMILGKRGYLQGKEAICFPGFEKDLLGAKLSEKRVVRDGEIITAAGMGVSLDFGLELVAALKGRETSEKLRKAVLAD